MIVGVTMVKDEADILGWTIQHLREQGVESVVVADNGSTDGTREIADLLADVVVDDPDPAHYQSRKVTRLVHDHCTLGDWVVPFDADEMWTGVDGSLAGVLRSTDAEVVTASVWDFLPQPGDDRRIHDPYVRTSWREPHPESLAVVAFRYHPDAVVEEGNHGVARPGIRATGLKVRHLQYRSFEQFCRKLRNGRLALEATDLPASTGAHWRTWGALDNDALRVEWERLVRQPLEHDPL